MTEWVLLTTHWWYMEEHPKQIHYIEQATIDKWQANLFAHLNDIWVQFMVKHKSFESERKEMKNKIRREPKPEAWDWSPFCSQRVNANPELGKNCVRRFSTKLHCRRMPTKNAKHQNIFTKLGVKCLTPSELVEAHSTPSLVKIYWFFAFFDSIRP